ncbi:protein VAPYRIN-like isoform X2 [Homarus americanus]|uniref:protein VAPYRIN-like isoform X2 n=1 Tax=Homarus americanus TaxID=6706 RepID=UPI001C444770|nr:protein VAPYRIN-like isoform X2 [Homarus americanus]XP_042240962.1 protein VAPYRIN-like isoform X2 [Homarus americanus]XP_042240963.1 protein VAPYRIN-like isoform X2 [Homarus americanus]XP_042240964.1 protein VAPYRIN-like isoform X2 [Homarus americanus]
MASNEEDDGKPCACPSVPYHALPEGMYLSAKNGKIMEVRQYLQNGSDINATDEDGYTLLSSACVGGQVALVRYLHKQPYLHRNTKTWAGDTPLMYAAMLGHFDVVKELITRPHPCRLDLDAVNNYNDTAISLAASNDHSDVVEYLQSVELPQLLALGDFKMEKSPTKVQSCLEIKFECQVCLEDYDNIERRPRSLSCGHSLCTNCVAETLMRGKLNCPYCRARHVPDVQMASQVPVNYTVDNVIQEQNS